MAQEDLVVKISANTSAAVAGLDQINEALKQTNQYLKIVSTSMTKVEDSTESLGESALYLNAALDLMAKGFSALQTVFNSTFDKFVEADTASNKLSTTLRLLGESDLVAVEQNFQEFAETLESSSSVADDTSIALLSMAKAMGLTNDQAKQLVQTSADLSAVNGKDVKSSFDELIDTYKGVGRGVVEYDRAVKGLSEAQLRNGAAVDLLSKKYAGFAKDQTKTLGGQLIQVRHLYEKTLEDIGKLFADFFKLGDQKRTLAALAAVRAFINTSLAPALMKLRDTVADFTSRLLAGFDQIADKADLLKAALIPLGAAAAVAFGPAVLAWLAAFATSLAASAASMAILSAQMLAAAAAATALAAAIEFVYNNFSKLGDIGTAVFDSLKSTFAGFVNAITDQVQTIWEAFKALFDGIAAFVTGGGISALVSGSKEAVDKLYAGFKNSDKNFREAMAKSNQKLVEDFKNTAKNLDFGVAGKAIQGVSQFVKGFGKDIEQAAVEQDNLTASVNKTKGAFVGLSIEGQKALDDLKKKVLDLESARVTISRNELDISKARLDAEMLNIAALERELKNKGALNAEGQKLLAQARALAAANSNSDISEKQAKALDEILQKNRDLQVGVDSFNKTQAEVIDIQLRRQMELIDLKQRELEKQGLITDEILQGLDAQRKAVGNQAGQAKSKAPNQAGEAIQMAGMDAAKGITDAFAPMMGVVSAVNAYVAAAQAVVDAVPQMLDNITNLIDSIVELPMRILNSLSKLLDSILKFIANLLPNLIKAVLGVFKAIGSFLKQLPMVIVDAIMQIPALVTELLTELPMIIKDIIFSLVTAAPQIISALVTFLIKDAPKIALQLAYFLGIELPKAIIGALWDGLKAIGKGLQSLFSGKGFKMFDMKDIKKNIEQVAKEISASASRLFQVADLANATKDAKSIMADVRQAGDDVIKKILNAFRWVWDNVIKPIWELVVSAWRWVWDNVLKPIWEMIVGAWRWVWDNVLKPMVEAVKAVFQWVWDKIFKPIIDGLTAVFQWVWDKVFKPIIDAFTAVFTWVWDKIFKPILDTFRAIFESVGKFFQPLLDAAKNIGEAIWKPIKDGFDSIADFFKNIINDAKSALGIGGGGGGFIGQSIDKISNGLGKLGSALGLAEGGIVPGMSSVAGNSSANDNVLSWLSPGEAVINRELMANANIANLVKAIMSEGKGFNLVKYLSDLVQPQNFAMGGIAGMPGLNSPSAMSSSGGGGTIVYNIALTARVENRGEPITPDYVKARLMPAIKDELKRSSLKGDFILSRKGIRDA